MNRKGFELSTTFLVGIILGIVLLSFGVYFIFQIAKTAEGIQPMLPSNFEYEVENCINRNERFCVPEIRKETRPGKTVNFGIVINNNYGEQHEFKIVVTNGISLLKDGSPASPPNINDWTLDNFGTMTLQNREHTPIPIPFQPPLGTKQGTYVFNINICFDSPDNPSDKCGGAFPSLYSPTQQVTVVID